jgi:tetratricopeptide (TPR) repeat protein
MRARLHYERGEVQKTLDDLAEELRLRPDNAPLYLRRGLVHTNRQDWPRALADFDAALRHDPRNGPGYAARAYVHSQTGEWARAVADCDKARQLGDERPATFTIAAVARLRTGDVEKALADCDAALRRDPNWTQARHVRQMALEARRQGDRTTPGLPPLPTAPLSVASGALMLPAAGPALLPPATTGNALDGGHEESKADASGDRYYEEGRSRLNAGNFHEAIIAFDKAIRRDPEDSFAYLKRGMAHAALDEDKEALADFGKVIKLDPKNPKPYLYRALVHLHRKDHAAAVADCTEAIRLRPEESDAYLYRGNAHDQMKEHAAARDDFRSAVKAAPSSAVAQNALAWLLATCPDGALRDGAKAVEVATRACELSAWNQAQLIDTLAAAYAECGKFDEALKWQQKAVDLASDKDRDELRTRLELFKKGKAYRQP